MIKPRSFKSNAIQGVVTERAVHKDRLTELLQDFRNRHNIDHEIELV